MFNTIYHEDEVWENILGFPDYIISNHGRVWSRKTNRYLKSFLDKDGYEIVSLFQNYKRKDLKIHRLVASAFIPNPLRLNEVNHEDGDKHYNYIDNLEWNTHDENMQHAFRNNLSIKRPVRIIETNEIFDSITACANSLGSAPSHIHNCVSGLCKRHKGYTFEYVD